MAGSAQLTVNGAISQSGTRGLTKTGAGVLVLGAENAFTGTTDIAAGKIVVNHAYALDRSTVWINVDNGLDVTTHSVNATLGSLAGSGALNLGSAHIYTGLNGDTATYSGAISGSGGVHVGGSGTQTLSADSTYSGGTSVAEGATLAISADNNIG
ncbi:hypothetical protein LCGC14_2607420, partial [marine sediment metagenome]